MWPFKKNTEGAACAAPEDEGYTDEELSTLFNQINNSFGNVAEALMAQAKLNGKIIEALDNANIKINIGTSGPTRH